MNSSQILIACLALAILTMACPAGVSASEVIDSSTARRASTTTARAIKWETSLPEAQAQAERNRKPILWVHMLGNIDGFT
ncbi:MAG: hypothetical protein IPM23_04640 [Candidatus Melainabacteria bacterium]|nr:hypothetical protein [Candidatus Melainabacteria bacterium]